MNLKIGTATLLALALATGAAAESEAGRLAPLLGLRPGAVVAEIGASDGAVAIELAARVGAEGRVYATELEEEQRAEIRAAATRAGAGNLVVLAAEVDSTALPAACCDAVVMRHVYHHLTEPAAVDRDLMAALRPGGVLVVVDFPPTWFLRPFTPNGVGPERARHGIEPADALAELQAAGFETISPWQERWLGPDTYALVLRKPAAAP